MAKFKISDFTVGQTAYLELTGDAKRGKREDELIQECVIEAVGRKYVTVKGRKFEVNDVYDGLVEHSIYSPNYILYPTRKDVEDKLEKDALLLEIKQYFSRGGSKLSLEKLREIKDIISK